MFFGKSEIRLDSPVENPPDGQITGWCRFEQVPRPREKAASPVNGEMRFRFFEGIGCSRILLCTRPLFPGQRTFQHPLATSEKCPIGDIGRLAEMKEAAN